MKITHIESFVLRAKLDKPFCFSQWSYSERSICLVKITTDGGFVGWGEGYGPATIIDKGIEFLKPFIIGEDPTENETIWYEMYRKTLDFARRGVLMASVSALDIALWDLKGKILDLPVYKMLGGKHRDRVQPYATGLYFSKSKVLSDELVIEAKNYVNEGFKAIKMKVGLSLEEDIHNIKCIREAIGDEIKLMVDANHAYSLREAFELSRMMEPYRICWFEEPISPEFYTQYRELREKTNIPIAAGECEYLRYGFHQLLENKSVDILQLDIGACGGITESKRIASLAATYGIEVIPHIWGSGISLNVAIHFIANLEPMPGRLNNPDVYMEYDRTENPIRESITSPSIKFENGFISIPSTSGLGLKVNEDIILQYQENNI